MQSPTNTVDKCSCAIAKIVKGNKLDNTATQSNISNIFLSEKY